VTGPGEDAEATARAGADLDAVHIAERVERMLLGADRAYTRHQVAERAGVSAEDARRLWKALGFATAADEDVVFTDSDVSALRQVELLADKGLAAEELLAAMTRMLGQTFSRLASWQGQLLVELLAGRPELLESEDSVVGLIEQLVPLMEDLQGYVWRRQLAAYFSRVAASAVAETGAPGDAATAVGFADMSGFTTLTRHANEAALRELLEAFESTATEVVGRHHGRIVKTIGDEVLFVADGAADGAQIALGLLEAAAADDRLPPLRVGLAAGPVVSRLGDVYGSTVNIASRLTSLCRPGWILVDRVVAEELATDARFALKSRRPESVRGYHHLRQWRLRRADDGDPGSPQSERAELRSAWGRSSNGPSVKGERARR
jgi:adenylate cyclase